MWVWFMCAGIANIIIKYGPIIKKKKKKATRPTLFENFMLLQYNNFFFLALQMVFLTSTVINSNKNMKELEHKIKCEKLMFR